MLGLICILEKSLHLGVYDDMDNPDKLGSLNELSEINPIDLNMNEKKVIICHIEVNDDDEIPTITNIYELEITHTLKNEQDIERLGKKLYPSIIHHITTGYISVMEDEHDKREDNFQDLFKNTVGIKNSSWDLLTDSQTNMEEDFI